MAAISPQFLDELRTRTSLVSLVGQTVKLTRKGRDYWGRCPFHNEKTASFTVNDEKEFYHCFGCGEHGDAIDFAMKAMGYSFPEAVEFLARNAGMEMPKLSAEEYEQEKKRADIYDVLEQTCRFFEEQLYKQGGQDALFYLQKRGLSDETIKQFRLGFAPGGNALKALLTHQEISEDLMKKAGVVTFPEDDRSPYDYFRNRVIFPITDRRGRIIAFGGRVLDDGEPKYLNSPDTPVFSKGDNLYALHLSAEQARKMQEIIVVEGYMDVIALHSAGIKRAVAPLGTALTERQIELLWKYALEPLCCFDGDTAGQRAASRAADRALPLLKAGHSLKFITLPDNLDPDDYIKERGTASFEQFLREQSRPLFKQLWRMLTHDRNISTPERKAGLEKEIEDTLRKIKDESVRTFYRQEFKSALWEITAPFKNKKKTLFKTPFNKPNSAFYDTDVRLSVHHPALMPDRDETRMMMAYLALHPEISSEFLEELAAWKPTELKLAHAMEMILTALAENPDITDQQLEEYIRFQEKSDLFDLLKAEIEILKRKKPHPQEVKQDMALRLLAVRKKALRAELQTLAAKIAEASDEDVKQLWEHYKKVDDELKGLA